MYTLIPFMSVVSAPKIDATIIYSTVRKSPLPAVPIVNFETVLYPK